MLQFDNLQHCNQILAYTVPLIVTTFISILTFGVWILWDEWKMKKEDAEYQKSLLIPEALEVEEIPRKYLYFQKLALQLSTQKFLLYYSENEVLLELMQWMHEQSHKNAEDLEKLLHILQTDQELTNVELYQVETWLKTAFYIWSYNPRWIMPAWNPVSFVRNRSWTIS